MIEAKKFVAIHSLIDDVASALEREVDEAIAVCDGDVRAALCVTLIANAFLETKIERLTTAVSTGFARGQIHRPPNRIKEVLRLGSWAVGDRR